MASIAGGARVPDLGSLAAPAPAGFGYYEPVSVFAGSWPEAGVSDSGSAGRRGRRLGNRATARLAVACAAAGQIDRAAAEGMTSIEIVKTTRSDRTTRELSRLARELTPIDAPAATEYRQAFATP